MSKSALPIETTQSSGFEIPSAPEIQIASPTEMPTGSRMQFAFPSQSSRETRWEWRRASPTTCSAVMQRHPGCYWGSACHCRSAIEIPTRPHLAPAKASPPAKAKATPPGWSSKTRTAVVPREEMAMLCVLSYVNAEIPDTNRGSCLRRRCALRQRC